MTTQTEALKLAEQWQTTEWNTESPMAADAAVCEAHDVINALIDAFAQPEQEPVAIYQLQKSDGSWIDQDKGSYRYNSQHGHTVRIVYTTPPQRKPLTDEQIKEALADMSALQMPFNKLIPAIARAIEAAHGIKGDA